MAIRKKTALFLSLMLFLFTLGAFLPAQTALAANPVTYRGLFVGCANYRYAAKLTPSTYNDANEFCYIFSNAAYDGVNRKKGKMLVATDLDKGTLAARLNPASSGSAYYGADANDISIFNYSGHGTVVNGKAALYLYDRDSNKALMTVDELEKALRKIPGKVVVILDCCYSGGMIGKTQTSGGSKMSSNAFSEALQTPFQERNRLLQARALLNSPKYVVITASSGSQYSYGEVGIPDAMGCFSRVFADGLGRTGQFNADTNNNRVITAYEAYKNARNNNQYSAAQLYPYNASLELLRYSAPAAVKGKIKMTACLYSSTLSSKTRMLTLRQGYTLSIYGALGNYYKVKASNRFGYVLKTAVSIVSTPTPSPSPTKTPAPTGTPAPTP